MTEQELRKAMTDLKERLAKWLFKNRHRLPNQRFYANWYDEISASPLTEKEYLNLASEILQLFPEYEPVELEVLCDEEIRKAIADGEDVDCYVGVITGGDIAISRATVRKNQAKGKLLRVKEG